MNHKVDEQQVADLDRYPIDDDVDLDALDDGSGLVEEEAEEESEEESEEEEPKGKKAEAKKDTRIPKPRFDEVNQRLKEAQRRNEELERKLAKTSEDSEAQAAISDIQNRLNELDDELSQAIIDADTQKVKALRAEERQLLGEARQIELEEHSTRIRTQARYDLLVDQVEEQYPQYDQKSDSFDAELLRETNAVRYGYLSQGFSPEEALQKAVKYVYPQFYPQQQETPSLREEPKPTKRKTTTPTERNKKVAKAQPADVSSRRARDDDGALPDVSKMSDEEFDKLPEKVLARLRGDFVDAS